MNDIRTDLPHGTVTFLFSDVEGSTKLLEQHPAEMGAALARHHALFEEVVAGNDGVIFETVGDAVYAAFQQASDAVAAALSAHRALAEEDWGAVGRMAVRIAIHTGEVEVRGSHYFGPPLFRCARLQALGYGEQTLVSAVTASLVRVSLSDGASLKDLGIHRLKDLGQPEQVFQLDHQTLRRDFPALKSLDQHRHNLPLQLSSFVGREREVEDVVAAVDQHRLVTLTGPGGIGKTRLALHAGAEQVGAFPDGVMFVDVSSIHDADLVENSLATSLGLRETPDESIGEKLIGFLASRKMLLIVDNFEQVVAAAPILGRLLQACPGLHIVATSRVPLHLRGEHEHRVPALGGISDHREGSVDPAVELFLQRARDVDGGFALNEESTEVVMEICRRLDRIPLAIELAAARVRLLGLRKMLERLDRSLPLLTGGAVDAPARHRTLRSTIGWSYDLLAPDGRALFSNLGAFIGGFTLDALESVSETEDFELLEQLTALVESNLVHIVTHEPDTRFSLLETIREFASEQLEQLAPTALARHASFYRQLTSESDHLLRQPGQLNRLRLIDLEMANIRAAIGFFRGDGNPAWLVMVADLWRYWRIRGMLTEALDLLDAAVPAASGSLRGRLLLGRGALKGIRGDADGGNADLDEAVGLLETDADLVDRGEALTRHAMVIWDSGDVEEVRKLVTEAIKIADAAPSPWLRGLALNVLGWTYEQGPPSEPAEAERAWLESWQQLSASGDRLTALHPRLNLVGALLARAKLDAAETELQKARSEVLELGELVALASVHELEARLLLARGAFVEAEERALACLRVARESGDTYYTAVGEGLLQEIRERVEPISRSTMPT